MAAMKDAKGPADYQAAVAEFDQATLAAPWMADAYYQAALAREKAQDFAGASAQLKLYLLVAPNAANAKDAKTLMYELEYRSEKAAKESAERADQAGRVARAEQVLAPLKGSWFGHNCQAPGDDYFAGCTDAMKGGRNWHRFNGSDGPFRYDFTFAGDGTVRLDAYESWAECKPGAVWGVALGAYSLSDVRWEWRVDGQPARPVYSEIASDGTYLLISCDRPLSGHNPSFQYHYVYWGRP